jgi:PAS domain S-box-containing protein
MLNAMRHYEVLVRASAIGIALVAPDGQWLPSNPALCELLGYTESELSPDDLESDLSLVEAILEGRRDRYHLEKRYFLRSSLPCSQSERLRQGKEAGRDRVCS